MAGVRTDMSKRKILSIGDFRKLIQNSKTAKHLLFTHPKLCETTWKGRILRGLANGLSAKQACFESYKWEQKAYLPSIIEPAEEFYSYSQIVSSTRESLKTFTELFQDV